MYGNVKTDTRKKIVLFKQIANTEPLQMLKDKVVKAGGRSLQISVGLMPKCKGNNFRKSIAFEHNITRIVFLLNLQIQIYKEKKKTATQLFLPVLFCGLGQKF